MKYYHASPNKDIKTLEPRVSNHDIPLIYFSDKRENVLVYLSNAVEKTCKEEGFIHNGPWYKWGPYGFGEDGRLRFEEYYPNALQDTYIGVPGYIYSCNDIKVRTNFEINIPNAHITDQCVNVDECEFIADAYEEILDAEKRGFIAIIRYEQFIERGNAWLDRVIRDEYANNKEHPEYQYFLKRKFGIFT